MVEGNAGCWSGWIATIAVKFEVEFPAVSSARLGGIGDTNTAAGDAALAQIPAPPVPPEIAETTSRLSPRPCDR